MVSAADTACPASPVRAGCSPRFISAVQVFSAVRSKRK